jgi:hypothetical protein
LAFVFAAGGALAATPVMGLSGKRACPRFYRGQQRRRGLFLLKNFFSFVFLSKKNKQIR